MLSSRTTPLGDIAWRTEWLIPFTSGIRKGTLGAEMRGGVFPVLSKKMKEHFKKSLNQRLNENLEKPHDTLVDINDLRDWPSDRMDQASFSSDISLTSRIRDREAKLIWKIRGALERLEDGTFGICEECGEEISLKRLMARPVTTLCIECKKEQETEERTRAASCQIPDFGGIQRGRGMKWVEIITLRHPGYINRELVDELLKSVDESDAATDASKHLVEIKVYHHSVVESDLSIHVHWESEKESQDKSPLGLRFSSALKPLGLLNHSVWVETAAMEFPLRHGNSKSRDILESDREDISKVH